MTRRSSSHWPWALAAAAATVLAFLPVLSNGFVNWDDDVNFLANPSYRGLGPEQIRWMFTTFHLGPYQPLSWLTLGLDYTVWRMDARGYHLTSLLFHAANAALFLELALALAGRRPRREMAPALVAALLFSIHPLRVESVAWITERRDVVSGFFFLLMLTAYVRAAGSTPLAFAAFVLSLLSKATGVTAPIILLVLDVYPLRRLPARPAEWLAPGHRRVLIEKVPYLLMAILFGVVALIGQQEAKGLQPVAAFSIAQRLGLTVYAAGFYLLKTILPLGLSPLYEMKGTFSAASPAVLVSAGAVLAVTIALVALRRRWPAGLVAWIVYLVMMFPVSGVARTGHQLAADRYTYLACMPWALLGGAALTRLKSPRAIRAGRIAAAAILLLLGGLAFVQARTWRDSISLWQHALRVDPESEGAAMNLASALVEVQSFDAAAAVYRGVIARKPQHADARYSLGMVLYLTGRVAEARQTFGDLVRDQPGFAMGHFGLGIMAMEMNDQAAARAELQEALRLKPDLAKAREALATLR